MGAQRFLKAAMSPLMRILDAEEITVDGKALKAVIDETGAANTLGTGAMDNQRTLVVQFPANAITFKPKSGQRVVARGEKWQISSEEGAIKTGQVATTLILVEPQRREN